jgi:hypothetical protein
MRHSREGGNPEEAKLDSRLRWNDDLYFMKPIAVMLVAMLSAPSVGAHHSYTGYDLDERYVFNGTLTDVKWGNPHILLFVSDGTTTMRVEWITTTGADVTGVTQGQLAPGQRITVIGSRHPDPDVATMAAIKQLQIVDKDWRWDLPRRSRGSP